MTELKGHFLSKKIIKSCDIRGIIDKDLSIIDAYFVGRSFASFLMNSGQKSCVVGRDGRLSSEDFSSQLIAGLIESGIDVTDIGLIPVGTVYFSLTHLNITASVMVTASHNPAEYNGFKFISHNLPFHGDDLIRMEHICREGAFTEGKGSVQKKDIRAAYIDYIQSFIEKKESSDLKIVWDPGNGAIASVLGKFTESIPGKHTLICADVDGNFPNHHPDPSVEKNVQMLKKNIQEQKADLGISFDGDGDRMAIVDSEGHLYYGDQLLVLLAQDLLEEYPGSVILSEVKASRFFIDEIERMGGIPLLWKVGHTNQKDKMLEMDIRLAGETSGHFYFKENGNFDDALFTAVKVLQLLYSKPDSLIDMKKRIPLFHDSGEIRIKLHDKNPDFVLDKVKKYLVEENADFSDVDGIRRESNHGFWIIRKSNTEPHLTVRCEDKSEGGYKESLNLIKDILHASGLNFTV